MPPALADTPAAAPSAFGGDRMAAPPASAPLSFREVRRAVRRGCVGSDAARPPARRRRGSLAPTGTGAQGTGAQGWAWGSLARHGTSARFALGRHRWPRRMGFTQMVFSKPIEQADEIFRRVSLEVVEQALAVRPASAPALPALADVESCRDSTAPARGGRPSYATKGCAVLHAAAQAIVRRLCRRSSCSGCARLSQSNRLRPAPTSAPGLAHSCAGTGPHLRRDCPNICPSLMAGVTTSVLHRPHFGTLLQKDYCAHAVAVAVARGWACRLVRVHWLSGRSSRWICRRSSTFWSRCRPATPRCMLHVARSMLHAARRRWPLHCPPTRHTPRSLEDAHAAAGSAALLQRARVQPARVAARHAVRACVRRCAGSRSCCSCMCCRTRLRRSTRIRSRRRPPAAYSGDSTHAKRTLHCPPLRSALASFCWAAWR